MKDIQVSQGRSVSFQVQVTGSPTPVITWLKDNFLFSPDHEYQVIEGIRDTLKLIFGIYKNQNDFTNIIVLLIALIITYTYTQMKLVL